MRNLRTDLLARASDGVLRHVEIQTSNEAGMGFRMLEYYMGLYRFQKEHVGQTLLYVGRDPLRMGDTFETPTTRHWFRILNLREMDGEELLASEDWTDNEWALLTKADRERVFRVVFTKLRELTGEEQQAAATTFTLIRGITGVEEELRRRLEQEDTIDVMENKILGPAIQQGIELGEARGEAKGMGRLLQRSLEKKFGKLPQWVAEKVHAASPELLEQWNDRVYEAKALEEIFSPSN